MSDENAPPPEKGAAPAAPEATAGLSRTEAKLRAAFGGEQVQAAIERAQAADDLPDPPAPDPVVVLAEKGDVIVAGDRAAAAYVDPITLQPVTPPRDTLRRVQLDEHIDPRRQPTERRRR